MSDSSVAADWYADPSGRHQMRYWNGSAWTEHVADNGAQSVDPLQPRAEIVEESSRPGDAQPQARARREERDSARAALKEERDARRAQRAAEREAARAEERRQAKVNPIAMFGTAVLRAGLLHYEFKKIDMTAAHAEATMGAPGRRSTFTRMGAGALIAGPAGLIVGAVARKDTSKCYVTIDTPDGVIVIEGRAKDYPAAVKFADAVNRSRRLPD